MGSAESFPKEIQLPLDRGDWFGHASPGGVIIYTCNGPYLKIVGGKMLTFEGNVSARWSPCGTYILMSEWDGVDNLDNRSSIFRVLDAHGKTLAKTTVDGYISDFGWLNPGYPWITSQQYDRYTTCVHSVHMQKLWTVCHDGYKHIRDLKDIPERFGKPPPYHSGYCPGHGDVRICYKYGDTEFNYMCVNDKFVRCTCKQCSKT